MEIHKAVEVLKGLITGKNEGRKPTVDELEEILEHQDIQLLPDGSIVSIRVTKKEKEALQHAISALQSLDEAKNQAAGVTVCNRCARQYQPILTKVIEERDRLREALEDNFQKGRRIEIEKYEPKLKRIKDMSEEELVDEFSKKVIAYRPRIKGEYIQVSIVIFRNVVKSMKQHILKVINGK